MLLANIIRSIYFKKYFENDLHHSHNSLKGYLEQGMLVTNSKKLAKRYFRTWMFPCDLLSVTPTDLLFLPFGLDAVYVRFNRLLRLTRLNEFFDRTESRTNYPNCFRIGHLVLYILVIIHWNGCFYFMVRTFRISTL